MKVHYRIIMISLVFALTIAACGGDGGGSESRQATVQALELQLVSTATAEAIFDANPDALVQTAEARATAVADSLVATQSSQRALSEEVRSATATAFTSVAADLSIYGVDPSQGRPGWVHPPTTVEVNGYRQHDYANQFLNTVAEDFVISADITWNTQYGNSGCGFVLRSDGNEESFNQYVVVITRGASGHVLFTTMADGEVVNARDIYAYGLDDNFDWQNDTTNRLTVVGRGQKFSIYTNDTLLGVIDPSEPPPQPYLPPAPQAPAVNDPATQAAFQRARAKHNGAISKMQSNYNARLKILQDSDTVYDRGFNAMVAVSESGQTTCQFDNAWLWLFE